jgi:Putative prokaryotic signal transducing protein
MAKSPEHPEHVVPVTSMPNELEAGVVVAALEEVGIKSTMSGVYTAGFRAEAPGQVQILVAKEDEARAREVIRLGEENKEDVDWSQVDVGQPEDE